MTIRLPRGLLLLATLLLAFRVGLTVQAALHPRVLLQSVNWRTAPEALAEAERTGRPLLYDFSADWCRPCKRMAREIFADAEAGRLVNETFVPTRVEDGLASDGLSDEQAAALRRAFGVEAFPTLLVVQGGEVRGRLVGYPGRENTLAFLQSSLADSP